MGTFIVLIIRPSNSSYANCLTNFISVCIILEASQYLQNLQCQVDQGNPATRWFRSDQSARQGIGRGEQNCSLGFFYCSTIWLFFFILFKFPRKLCLMLTREGVMAFRPQKTQKPSAKSWRSFLSHCALHISTSNSHVHHLITIVSDHADKYPVRQRPAITRVPSTSFRLGRGGPHRSNNWFSFHNWFSSGTLLDSRDKFEFLNI